MTPWNTGIIWRSRKMTEHHLVWQSRWQMLLFRSLKQNHGFKALVSLLTPGKFALPPWQPHRALVPSPSNPAILALQEQEYFWTLHVRLWRWKVNELKNTVSYGSKAHCCNYLSLGALGAVSTDTEVAEHPFSQRKLCKVVVTLLQELNMGLGVF